MEKEKFVFTDLRNVRERERRNALLAEFYHNFLVPFFGKIPDQLDSFEKMEASMNPLSPDWNKTVNHIVLAFDVDTRKIAGGVVFEFYPISRCGLVSYFCVSDEYRRYGLGRTFLQTAQAHMDSDCFQIYGTRSRGVFLETNSPLRIEKDVIHPEKRLAIFRNLGCSLLDFDYVQPPICPGLAPDTNMVLVLFRRGERDNRKYLPGNVILSFLEEFWTICQAPLEHPYFLNAIPVLHNQKIAIKDLTVDNIRRIECRVTGRSPSLLSSHPVSAQSTPETNKSGPNATIEKPFSPIKFKSNL